MKETIDTKPLGKAKALEYYNFDALYSYNGVYNFCIGGRGLGKTYGAKLKAIKAAIKKGEQFIYLRRYKSELKAKDGFFADLIGEFPNHIFRLNGGTAEMTLNDGKDKPDWKLIGYFVALSTTQSLKGMSYPLVTLIIFDEFIIEKGAIHYLPNEAEIFTNFFSTVDRYKDKTRVLFLANSVSITNPYFIEYGIEPKAHQEWIKSHGGFIICHFPESAEFSKGVYETRFGKFIQNTDYAEYAVGNGFKDNSDNLLNLKNSEATYLYSLETKIGTFSIWKDYDTREWYIQERRPKNEILFTLQAETMAEGKQLLLNNDQMLQILRNNFSKGRVSFDKPKTRNSFIQIFKR